MYLVVQELLIDQLQSRIEKMLPARSQLSRPAKASARGPAAPMAAPVTTVSAVKAKDLKVLPRTCVVVGASHGQQPAARNTQWRCRPAPEDVAVDVVDAD